MIPDILWHGTSAKRLDSIISDGLIKVATCGVEAVSTSRNREVAIMFGLNATRAEVAEGNKDAAVKILKINARQMLIDGYRFEPFSDSIWGPGECDWEEEYVCWLDVPMRYVTIEDPM